MLLKSDEAAGDAAMTWQGELFCVVNHQSCWLWWVCGWLWLVVCDAGLVAEAEGLLWRCR
jgi:hypothetical protein